MPQAPTLDELKEELLSEEASRKEDISFKDFKNVSVGRRSFTSRHEAEPGSHQVRAGRFYLGWMVVNLSKSSLKEPVILYHSLSLSVLLGFCFSLSRSVHYPACTSV